MNVLEKKKRALLQKKARLQQSQALIKIAERKQKLSRRIRIGELAEKAGLEFLDPSTLLGALLSLKEKIENKTHLDEWKKVGEKFLKISESSLKEKGIPLSISFEGMASTDDLKEVHTSLRSLGFKWNKIRQEWEGKGDIEKIQKLINPYGGIVKEI